MMIFTKGGFFVLLATVSLKTVQGQVEGCSIENPTLDSSNAVVQLAEVDWEVLVRSTSCPRVGDCTSDTGTVLDSGTSLVFSDAVVPYELDTRIFTTGSSRVRRAEMLLQEENVCFAYNYYEIEFGPGGNDSRTIDDVCRESCFSLDEGARTFTLKNELVIGRVVDGRASSSTYFHQFKVTPRRLNNDEASLPSPSPVADFVDDGGGGDGEQQEEGIQELRTKVSYEMTVGALFCEQGRCQVQPSFVLYSHEVTLVDDAVLEFSLLTQIFGERGALVEEPAQLQRQGENVCLTFSSITIKNDGGSSETLTECFPMDAVQLIRVQEQDIEYFSAGRVSSDRYTNTLEISATTSSSSDPPPSAPVAPPPDGDPLENPAVSAPSPAPTKEDHEGDAGDGEGLPLDCEECMTVGDVDEDFLTTCLCNDDGEESSGAVTIQATFSYSDDLCDDQVAIYRCTDLDSPDDDRVWPITFLYSCTNFGNDVCNPSVVSTANTAPTEEDAVVVPACIVTQENPVLVFDEEHRLSSLSSPFEWPIPKCECLRVAYQRGGWSSPLGPPPFEKLLISESIVIPSEDCPPPMTRHRRLRRGGQ